MASSAACAAAGGKLHHERPALRRLGGVDESGPASGAGRRDALA